MVKPSKQRLGSNWNSIRDNLRSGKLSPFVEDVKGSKGIKEVSYESENHWSVLTQMNGSMWPHVLPYCLIASLEAYLIHYAKENGINLTYPCGGHQFMSLLVSFLVVTRTTITYNRFMTLRQQLGKCFQSCRELMQLTAMLTFTNKSPESLKWRRNVALKTIELLRVTIAAIQYESSQEAAYDILPESIKKGEDIFVQEGVDSDSNKIMKWAHGKRTATDENWRAPIVCAYNLRAEIMKIRQSEILEKQMHVNEELKILDQVSNFVTAFHGLKLILTTPYPFPLVQMSRTLLFFWVFTLPFCLVGAIEQAIHVVFIVFLITYGFLGLEYVSIELADPFGNDANDFDSYAMAQFVFEDIYIILYKIDGPQSAESLRKQVSAMVK
eukprot:CAMPEP_0197833282 /NCGR_PEP_ID=MMETSP1437-20131217/18504_1 /TAXON_ID=49252 ORGANISM="Eucampia antarctica, Strain CCMP1452" /NCGR_SAMPLE_ID=MMETSP1437 /ASSEMBLY_ACC=CAM_ASM_001096 /LENGTH=382 /DNA_ID=CAMNT_0043437247 /DNA_START=134 /DNA_END=1282 /DNA_ORIENTATION=+